MAHGHSNRQDVLNPIHCVDVDDTLVSNGRYNDTLIQKLRGQHITLVTSRMISDCPRAILGRQGNTDRYREGWRAHTLSNVIAHLRSQGVYVDRICTPYDLLEPCTLGEGYEKYGMAKFEKELLACPEDIHPMQYFENISQKYRAIEQTLGDLIIETNDFDKLGIFTKLSTQHTITSFYDDKPENLDTVNNLTGGRAACFHVTMEEQGQNRVVAYNRSAQRQTEAAAAPAARAASPATARGATPTEPAFQGVGTTAVKIEHLQYKIQDLKNQISTLEFLQAEGDDVSGQLEQEKEKLATLEQQLTSLQSPATRPTTVAAATTSSTRHTAEAYPHFPYPHQPYAHLDDELISMGAWPQSPTTQLPEAPRTKSSMPRQAAAPASPPAASAAAGATVQVPKTKSHSAFKKPSEKLEWAKECRKQMKEDNKALTNAKCNPNTITGVFQQAVRALTEFNNNDLYEFYKYALKNNDPELTGFLEKRKYGSRDEEIKSAFKKMKREHNQNATQTGLTEANATHVAGYDGMEL